MRNLLLSLWLIFALAGIANSQSTFTPILNLEKPLAAPGSFGEKINNNFDILDEAYGDFVSNIDRVTVATLPASPVENQVVVVTDALNSTTCITGGGTSNNTCQWDGANWVIIGGGGGGGGSGNFDELGSGTNTTAAMVVGTGGSLAATGSGTITATAVPWSGITSVDVEISSIAGLTSAADRVPYYTGSGTAALATFTSFGRSLVDDANAAAGLATLGTVSTLTMQSGAPWTITDAGANDSYTGCPSSAFTVSELVAGTQIILNPNTANTGAASLNPCTIGVKAIKTYAGADPADNTLLADVPMPLIYDGTVFRLPLAATVAEVDTLESVKGRDRSITSAASQATAVRIGSSSTGRYTIIYDDATTGGILDCEVAGVQGDCNKSIKLNSGFTFSFLNSAGTSKGTFTESTGAWTAVTLDAEASGNNIGTVSYIQILAASCIAATAVLGGDDDANGATPPTAACNDFGTTQVATANYAGNAVNTRQFKLALPPDVNLTASVGIKLRYYTLADTPSGNTEWDISTLCRAAGENATAAFNAAQTITDAVVAQTTNRWANDADQGSVTMTGCAADEDLYLLVSRDGVSDTNNDTAGLAWIRLALRRTQ